VTSLSNNLTKSRLASVPFHLRSSPWTLLKGNETPAIWLFVHVVASRCSHESLGKTTVEENYTTCYGDGSSMVDPFIGSYLFHRVAGGSGL